MARQVEQWEADDGTMYPTEAEAVAHDAAMADQARIRAYVATLPETMSERARTRVANTIAAFLAWERESR